MVAPLVVLGWMLVAGAGGAAAVAGDSILNDGKLRVKAGKAFGKDLSAENIKKKVFDKTDQTVKEQAYKQVVEPLGVQKSTFDDWWKELNPTGNAGIMGAIVALDKTLERFGIDVIDTKTAAILTVAYHFLITKGFGKQFLDYFTKTGDIDLGAIPPPNETPPRMDPHGFGVAASRKPAAPPKPLPREGLPTPALEPGQ